MPNNLPQLQYGDCLLYGGSSFFDILIKIKTWGPVCHVEVYNEEGKTFASRNGLGVAQYNLQLADLKYVLRPKKVINKVTSLNYFNHVEGQKYDWKGILCFTYAVKSGAPNEQFCSEFATNFYRAGQLTPFNPSWSADKVAPDDYLMSAEYDIIWMAKTL